MSDLTPLGFLLDWASKTPDAPAVRLKGIDMSYGELLEKARLRAGFLKEQGAGPGKLIAIYTDDELQFVLSLLGVWALGAVCIPMNIAQKPEKLKQMEGVVKPDLGFFFDFNPEFDRDFPMLELSDAERSIDNVHRSYPDDLSMVMFTSGTSGVPKAVPMTNRAIWHNCWETSGQLGITSSDRLLINTPPYTTSSIIHILTMLSRGASVVLERSFLFGSSILDDIVKFECTGFGGVPVHFTRLLAGIEDVQKPPKLRFLMNSGDHLPVPVIREIRKALPGVEIYCVYGLTEVAGRFCILSPDKVDEKIGSVGMPLKSMVVTVRDENGRELPTGHVGELHIQGPNLMTGYLNNPEANEKSMKSYGFATGDFGYKDEDGYLFLKGRHDDIFKVGGEKVSVKMIEESIFGFEDFEEFMVSPCFDEHMGNVPCLYYVMKSGKVFDRKGFLKALRQKLPHTHIPAKFIELEELPRTSSGKVIRGKLSKQ